MKLLIVTFLFLFFPLWGIFAQAPDDVSRLVSMENYLAARVKQKGIAEAFKKVIDENSRILQPEGMVNAENLLKQLPDSAVLSWEPVYARIAKSGDWGFTSGPFTYKEDETAVMHYGSYLSLWKKNRKGAWKLAYTSAVFHGKPKSQEPKLVFLNPKNNKFIHQKSQSRLEQRKDIIISSDQLYGTILKADNSIARKEFLSDDIRLLFPKREPVRGIKAVTAFWEKQAGKLTSKPIDADRAYSGELSMTWGEAAITNNKGAVKNYNYIRIWEIQPEFNWDVIIELFVPEVSDRL